MRTKRTRWLRWPFLLAVVYAALLALLMIFEEKLLFFPARYPAGDWDPPGLAFEDAWFRAEDGTKLHGWFVPHGNPRTTVLIAHGNGGNLSNRAELLRAFHGMGAASMIFDYRGYGRSEGSPTARGIIADARAARDWLAARASVPIDHIVLFGESLGGAVAVHLAAEGGARALVLENTFNSLADVAAHHYPWAPVKWLLRSKLDSAAWIRRYRGPLLQFHGDSDQTVPYACGVRLFEAANEPKELVTVPGGGHNHLNAGLIPAIERFLGRLGHFERR